MMFVKVALLRLFELFVLFTECLQVGPIWHQQLVGLWDWCSNPSSHAQLCRTEVTPRQWCCTIAQQSRIGIIWPLQQLFHCLNGPLYLAIALRKSWTARNVVELIWVCKPCKFLWWILRTIIASNRFWYYMSRKHRLECFDHCSRHSASQLYHFGISWEVVHCEKIVNSSISNRSVPTTCQGFSGSWEIINGSLLGVEFLAHSAHCCTVWAICWLIPGHHTEEATLALHLCISWWPAWIFCLVSSYKDFGTNIQWSYSNSQLHTVNEPRNFQ